MRHNIRAAFILCDGLIELVCFAKHDPKNTVTAHTGFDQHLKHRDVALDPATHPLGDRMQKNHYLRNKMHHVNAAATVDAQRCADKMCGSIDTDRYGMASKNIQDHGLTGICADRCEHIAAYANRFHSHSSKTKLKRMDILQALQHVCGACERHPRQANSQIPS